MTGMGCFDHQSYPNQLERYHLNRLCISRYTVCVIIHKYCHALICEIHDSYGSNMF